MKTLNILCTCPGLERTAGEKVDDRMEIFYWAEEFHMEVPVLTTLVTSHVYQKLSAKFSQLISQKDIGKLFSRSVEKMCPPGSSA